TRLLHHSRICRHGCARRRGRAQTLPRPPMRLKRIALLAFLAPCSHGQTGTVPFGAAGPFSRAYGLANKQGIQLALDEINSSPAWSGGRGLELQFAAACGPGARAS